MFQRRIPETLRYTPTPGVRGFALLAAIEATARGILISVFPIAMYRTFGDAQTVSEIYFAVGILSLLAALVTPGLTRFLPRRWLFSAGAVTMIAGAVCSSLGEGTWLLALGLAIITVATVVITVCFNAYVMDYIARAALGECEALRLFYSGAAWTIGPALGVWLMELWAPAPFVLSAVAATILLLVFWMMRLGNGKTIVRSRAMTPNPLTYLPRFLQQPRLVAGWTFAVVRSCGWWVYVVYLPIYAVEHGLSDQLGGTLLSLSNACLFLTPLMLRWMRGRVRYAVTLGFLLAGACFAAASLTNFDPRLAIVFLVAASFFLVLLDVCGGLPFLMAVRPSERTEMSAVYSTFRDVSGIVTPAVARMVLLVAPLPALFALTSLGFALTGLVATRVHPRLGNRRVLALASD